MKSILVGFESAPIDNGAIRSVIGPTNVPITLRGYHLDLSFVPLKYSTGLFVQVPSTNWAEILFYGLWVPTKPSGWVNGQAIWPVANNSISVQNNSVQPIGPATSVATDSTFAASILKAWMPEAVNKSLDASNLALAIPQGSFIVFEADHMGYAVDFEVQGVLFYD